MIMPYTEAKRVFQNLTRENDQVKESDVTPAALCVSKKTGMGKVINKLEQLDETEWHIVMCNAGFWVLSEKEKLEN